MSVKEEIKKIIEKAVKGAGFGTHDFSLEMPKDVAHGDYSTNIAFVLGKSATKNPNELALMLKRGIEKDKKIIKKVEVVGGFINFFVNDTFFNETIKEILKRGKDFGKNQNLKNQKIIIEYTNTNILKEFHIGHLMGITIGESLSRIFEFQGANLKRDSYQSDVGLHIAKTVWGRLNMKESFRGDTKSWNMAYAYGSEMYENDERAKSNIIDLNKKIFDKSDAKVNKIYEEGKKISLQSFGEIYKKLDTKFDYIILESQVADFGKKIVEGGLKKGVFEKGENGAVIFKGEKFGLHTRVFLNSEGLPTYEAKDLALAKFKYGKFKYDKSIVITANEQNEYFKVMLCALKQIDSKLAERTKHIGHGMMRLPEGKMSSRTGNVITFEFLLGKVEKLVTEKIKDRDLLNEEKKEVIEKVAIGALRYSILKQSIGSDIVYDFEKSISFEGDSGPYLQYSCARAQSVLRKAKEEKIKASLKNIPDQVGQLERVMSYFPEIVEKAGREYQPHVMVLYLTELAQEFNHYYANSKTVDVADEFSPYKIALTEAFTIIIKNGLWLLGINSLEKM